MSSHPAVAPAPGTSRAGRDLPVAVAVGVALLIAVAASLFLRNELFGVVAVVPLRARLWELANALARRGVGIPVAPLLVGDVGILVSAYVAGMEALFVAFVLTVGGIVVWRVLDGSGPRAVRDATAGVFAAAYLPLMAGFVMLLLAEEDGALRVALFILLCVANDTGGYVVGVLIGRHPLAPSVSPKKTWEGLLGSVVLACVIGVLGIHFMFDGDPALGALLGVATVAVATLGDLGESMIKRDLELKDMGTLLPGHGGVLDRIDSMLLAAPVVFLLLHTLQPVVS